MKLLESGIFNNAEEIYSATIPELSALIRGRQEHARQELRTRNIHAGSIVAAIYNITRGKGKKTLQWDDIFKDPGSQADTSAEPGKPMDPQVAYQIFRAAFGGGT